MVDNKTRDNHIEHRSIEHPPLSGCHALAGFRPSRTARLLSLLLLGVVILAACGEDGRYGITFVNQGDHFVQPDERMVSDVAVAGGTMTLETDAHLTGNVYLFGGELSVDGTVDGDVAALGGSISLGDNSHISGDFFVAGSEVERSPGTTIAGEETELSSQELVASQASRSLTGFLWQLITTTVLAGMLTLLTVKLMPTLTRRLSHTSTNFPLVSGALGLLLLLVLPVFLVFMAFTIVLIPATIAGIIVLAILVAYGVIGIGRGIGERIALWRDWQIGPALSATIGTTLIVVLLNVVGLIPFAAEVLLTVVGAVGLGGVVLSGFGRRVYEPPEYDIASDTA